MLLQRGLDVNARDKDGLSPLLLAVRGRYWAGGGGRCGRCAGRGAVWGRAWTGMPQRGPSVCLWSHSIPRQSQVGPRTPASWSLAHLQLGPRH